MTSGKYSLTPRDPRMLSWRRGPLPDPQEGMAVMVFRPHFDLRCAAYVIYLMATTSAQADDVVWCTTHPHQVFLDELTEEDWWAPLGLDALYAIQNEFKSHAETSRG